MRSMQQFSESLVKMKLPMDLNKPETDNQGNVIQNLNSSVEVEKKKDAARVFYGSRAFLWIILNAAADINSMNKFANGDS